MQSRKRVLLLVGLALLLGALGVWYAVDDANQTVPLVSDRQSESLPEPRDIKAHSSESPTTRPMPGPAESSKEPVAQPIEAPSPHAEAPLESPAPVKLDETAIETVDVTWKGFVKDKEGNPIPGAVVRVSNVLTHERWDRKPPKQDGDNPLKEPHFSSELPEPKVTGDDGCFEFRLKAKVSHTHRVACVIEAAKEGFRTNYSETLLAGYHRETEPTEIVLVPGTGSISGRLILGDLASPPPSIRIGLYGGDGMSAKSGIWPPDGDSVSQVFPLLVPDASGGFRFDHLPTGLYHVVAHDMDADGSDRVIMGWDKHYGELAWASVSWVKKTEIKAPGDTASVEIGLPLRRTLRFQIVDTSYVEIIAALCSTRGGGRSSQTWPEALKKVDGGYYLVPRVMEQHNEVELTRKGFPSLTVAVDPKTDDLGVLDFGKPHPGVVECRVTYADGKPVVGVTVQLFSMHEFAGDWDLDWNTPPETAVTNDLGIATIERLKPVHYLPAVTHASIGLLKGHWPSIPIGETGLKETCELKLPLGERLTGVLITRVDRKQPGQAFVFLVPEADFRADSSVHGGSIAVNTGGRHELRPATTQLAKVTIPIGANQASFEFPYVPKGKYMLYAILLQDGHTYASSPSRVDLGDGEVSVTLKLPWLTTVSGKALASDGSPLDGAEVAIFLPDGDGNDAAATIHTGIVAADGSYTIRNVPIGDWEVGINWRHAGSGKYRRLTEDRGLAATIPVYIKIIGDDTYQADIRLK